MVLQRWEQFRELGRAEDVLARHFRDYGSGNGVVRAWPVPLDVAQEGDSVVVKASIPGIKPDEVEVTIEDGLITIKGETSAENEQREGGYLLRERRSGSFYRALRLPETVDADKAESSYENGVLTVTLPKLESKKAKKVELKVA